MRRMWRRRSRRRISDGDGDGDGDSDGDSDDSGFYQLRVRLRCEAVRETVKALPIFEGNGALVRSLADLGALRYRRKRGEDAGEPDEAAPREVSSRGLSAPPRSAALRGPAPDPCCFSSDRRDAPLLGIAETMGPWVNSSKDTNGSIATRCRMYVCM